MVTCCSSSWIPDVQVFTVCEFIPPFLGIAVLAFCLQVSGPSTVWKLYCDVPVPFIVWIHHECHYTKNLVISSFFLDCQDNSQTLGGQHLLTTFYNLGVFPYCS